MSLGIGGSFMGRRSARWLYITAILEIVLAGVFLVIATQVPILRGGFMLTAAILGAVGLGLLFWARRAGKSADEADRIRTQGVAGTATITGMRQTGVYLNEQPQVELQLQVSTEMHGAYSATVKDYVPLMMLGTLTSGRPLPVKVDPSNPQRVVIEWGSAGGIGMPMGMPVGTQMPGMPIGAPAMQVGAPGAGYAAASAGDASDVKKRLLETGVSGTAKVISSAPTGQTDSEGRPVYSMMLQIEVQGHPPMQGPAVVGVPPERAELLEVGDTVPIKADANNPSLMAVDWENA